MELRLLLGNRFLSVLLYNFNFETNLFYPSLAVKNRDRVMIDSPFPLNYSNNHVKYGTD